MIEITRDNTISGSVYNIDYDLETLVPPVLEIMDQGSGVPVMENLVAITNEIEKRLNRNIRFFPVLVITKGDFRNVVEAYQVTYSDYKADDFTASASMVEFGEGHCTVSFVANAWCNQYLSDMTPEEIRIRLLTPLLVNVLGTAVAEGVKQYNQYLRHRGSYLSMARGYYEAVETAAASLCAAFYSVQSECMAAVQKVAEDGALTGRNAGTTKHLDDFLLALRKKQDHPTIVRKCGYTDNLREDVVAVYKVSPPLAASINKRTTGGAG